MPEQPQSSDAAVELYVPFNRDKRPAGADWPSEAHTQIGMRRLDNLQALVTKVLVARTPGDLVETGGNGDLYPGARGQTG